jgi:pantetheine-phosphate adenylyltransferase
MDILYKYNKIMLKYFSKGVLDDILKRWNEPHRFWHNLDHLKFLLNKIDNHFLNDYEGKLYYTDTYKSLIIAAYLHDVIYNPKTNNNENMSIEYLIDNINKSVLGKFIISQTISIIESTRGRKYPVGDFEKLFWYFDNDIIINGTIEELIDYENKIFKEFQFVDYNIYKEKRIEFLESNIELFGEETISNNMNFLISYIKTRKIRVGVYPGSFNPMHIGHLDILRKSEKIFDKVIVAYGTNPDKEVRDITFPKTIDYNQIDVYSTLLTEYVSSIEDEYIDVTVIRGLRNGHDLDYESNQLSFLKEIKPDIKVVYIPCNKKYEHISSSAIRSLDKFDKKLSEQYIVK